MTCIVRDPWRWERERKQKFGESTVISRFKIILIWNNKVIAMKSIKTIIIMIIIIIILVFYNMALMGISK